MNKPETTRVQVQHAGASVAARKRGKARVSDILVAATNILVNRGLANLTTRSVADDVGISVGNLAYYFPSKDALLRAIIEHVINGYDEELQKEFESFPDNPIDRFKAFLRYLVDDARKPEVQRFFYQLWGIATVNAQVAEARTDMYRHFSSQLLALLQDIDPSMDSQEMKDTAFGIMTCIEGLHVIFGSGDISHVHSRGFDQYMFNQLLQMAGLKDS